jgi:hypothetical protein
LAIQGNKFWAAKMEGGFGAWKKGGVLIEE